MEIDFKRKIGRSKPLHFFVRSQRYNLAYIKNKLFHHQSVWHSWEMPEEDEED